MKPGTYYKDSSQDIDSTPHDPDPLTKVQVESTISAFYTVKITSFNKSQAPISCRNNIGIVPIYNGQLLLTCRDIISI